MTDTKHTPKLLLVDSDRDERAYVLSQIVRRYNAHDDLLAACEFLMARCRDEGLDVVGGAYEAEFQHAHQTIAKATGE